MITPSDDFPNLYRAMGEEWERRQSEEVMRLRVRCQELYAEIRRLQRGEQDEPIKLAA